MEVQFWRGNLLIFPLINCDILISEELVKVRVHGSHFIDAFDVKTVVHEIAEFAFLFCRVGVCLHLVDEEVFDGDDECDEVG